MPETKPLEVQALLVAVQVGLTFPPFTPEQVQELEPPIDGNEGELGLGLPTLQNAPEKVVSVAEYPLAAGPQTPSCFKLALQEALVPLQEPLHDHDQGPVPETELGVPLVQRLVVGAV